MPNSYTETHLHYTWATFDRAPLITSDIEEAVYNVIRARCRDLQCHLLAINGMPDHVHVLLRLPATLTMAQIAQDLKGASSYLVTHTLNPKAGFRWQGSYFARCVERQNLDTVIGYIEKQKRHHADRTTLPDWEQCSE